MTHQHQTAPAKTQATAPQATKSQAPSTVLQFKPGVPGVGITALTGLRDVIHSTLQTGKLGAALRDSMLSLRAGAVDEGGPVIPRDSKWGTGNLKGPSDGLLLTEGGVYAWVMIQLSQEDLEAQTELTLSAILKNRSPYVESVEVYNQTWSSEQRFVSVHLHTPDHLLHAETMTVLTGRDVEIVQDNREATRRSYVYKRGAFRGLIDGRTDPLAGAPSGQEGTPVADAPSVRAREKAYGRPSSGHRRTDRRVAARRRGIRVPTDGRRSGPRARELLRLLAGRLTPEELAELRRGYGIA